MDKKIITEDLKRMFPELSLSAEESEKRYQEYRQRMTKNEDRFTIVSLLDWIDLVSNLKIPYVSATKVCDINVDDLVKFDQTSLKAVQKRIELFLNVVNAEAKTNEMMRWDCGTDAMLKYEINSGNWHWNPEFKFIYPGDVRTYEMIYEFPKTKISAVKRPWIETLIYKSYPVEYRVFVHDSEIKGFSNYYPQRELKYHDPFPIKEHINRCFEYTNDIINELKKRLPVNCPELDRVGYDTTKLHFTADFVIARDETVTYLEGGPPYTPVWGAHPCCFEPNQIDGIALFDRNKKD